MHGPVRFLVPLRLCRIVIVLLCSFAASAARAAAPAPEFIFPAGGKPGPTFNVTVGGKLDGWPVGVWTDHAGLVFKATTNSGAFTVSIAADVPPGPHLVRFFNDDGAAEPRTFVVGTRDEVLEVEPNDDFRKAQLVDKSAVVVNGRLEKAGDVDSFAIRAEQGKWIVAAVDCYALGASVDPVLQILDERGVRVALNHDTHNLDALVAWQAPHTGTYIVQLLGFAHPPAADVTAKGSPAYVYRLTLTTGPFVRSTFPMGLKRGAKGAVELVGWNLPKAAQPVDGTRVAAAEQLLFLPAAPTGDTLWLDVADAADVAEQEPNDSSAQAQTVAFPATVNGRIGRPGDVDRFAFPAKKNERFNFQMRAVGLRSPMAARLRVEDTNGVSLTEQLGGDLSDPRLGWNAPADGTYVLAVSDMYGQGGPEWLYRVKTAPAPPHFTATLPTHAFFVENGKTNEIKVTFARNDGFQEKLALAVKGLPDGVTARIAPVPDKGTEVKVELVATADAQAANVPIEFILSAPEVRPPMSRAATFSLRGTEPRGDRLVNDGHIAWLTVVNKPAPPNPPKKKE